MPEHDTTSTQAGNDRPIPKGSIGPTGAWGCYVGAGGGAYKPYMGPHGRGWGAPIPAEKCSDILGYQCKTLIETAKALCWVEETIRAAAVAGGADAAFTIEVKWWNQFQAGLNLSAAPTAEEFAISRIQYGQSDYQITFENLLLNGTAVDARGIDIRRFNGDTFPDRTYYFPASALNDAIVITFTNLTVGALDLIFLFEGPAVLQIG